MTEQQREQITDRFAAKLAEMVKRHGHNPRGADIEAMLTRAESLARLVDVIRSD